MVKFVLLCVSQKKRRRIFLRAVKMSQNFMRNLFCTARQQIRQQKNLPSTAIMQFRIIIDNHQAHLERVRVLARHHHFLPFFGRSFVNKLSTQQSNQTLIITEQTRRPHTVRAKIIENPLYTLLRHNTDCDAVKTQISNNSLEQAIISLDVLRFYIFFYQEKEKNAVEAKQSK